MSRITFNNKQSPFFKSLKEKVDVYFAENKLHTSGNGKLFFKGALHIVTLILLYVVLVFFTPGVFISVLLCCLMGFNLALIGFNIMHEGIHQSFSRHKGLNKITAYSLNFMGGNSFYWKTKHSINHHTYTNIEGMDFDIDVKPFMRLHENQPKYWIHRFQHIYWVILYGISYVAWIFYQDFEKYVTGKIAPGAEPHKLALREHIIFWATKLTYIALYLVLPIMMVGLFNALVGFAIIAFVCGLSISIVFQLAHMVQETHFPAPDLHSNKIEQEWAIHQVTTTANFATKNKVVCWLLGGLNFQVEHHLFPRISHIHYPKINQFVKETCAEFNVAYLEYPSMIKAFQSHLLHIKRLGRA